MSRGTRKTKRGQRKCANPKWKPNPNKRGGATTKTAKNGKSTNR